MSTTFSALVENKFWVLARIARMFSRHMFNIQSLSVAPTPDERVSCMTIDVEEAPERLERIRLELEKIENVLAVRICDPKDYVETEMVLVRISRANPHFRSFIQEVGRFRARVVYRHGETEIVEFSGDRDAIERFLNTSAAHDVEQVIRTGPVAMAKEAHRAQRAPRVHVAGSNGVAALVSRLPPRDGD